MIPRELTAGTQAGLAQRTAWYVTPAGSLDVRKLLGAFRDFFRENAEHWPQRFGYHEAGPQLLLQAFLQRVVNSGGRLSREYGLGRGRADLLIEWPVGEATEKTVVECKLLWKSLERTIAEGVEQTLRYMDRSGTRSGHLVIFDRDPAKSWAEKIVEREEVREVGSVTVWAM